MSLMLNKWIFTETINLVPPFRKKNRANFYYNQRNHWKREFFLQNALCLFLLAILLLLEYYQISTKWINSKDQILPLTPFFDVVWLEPKPSATKLQKPSPLFNQFQISKRKPY